MIVIKSNSMLSAEKYNETVEKLSEMMNDNIIILSPNLDLVSINAYEVWTKDRYIQEMLKYNSLSINIDEINNQWDEIREGYEFVIAIYQSDIKSYSYYSVSYFNNELLGGECNANDSKQE